MADFKLGRIKFKWRGNWATSTAFLIDDVVKYGGNNYVCIQNHTSPNNENLFYTSPGTYTSYWSLQSESLFFKGTYANTTWYKLNDLVIYGGKQYRVTTAHTSSSAVLDQSKFEQAIDGHTFRGDYASSTQYRLNDIVKYGGRQYRVSTEHTSASGGDPNIDLSKFTLYQEGLAFRGNWATSTYYRLDDVVKFGAYQYRCVEAHTSGGATTDFDQAKFNVYSEGLQWEDTYSASTVYQKGDVVAYGGYTYTYVNDNESSGNTPTDNSYWDIITTGYKNQGTYSHGTAYKTGDTVQYGGNSYVCNTNHTNQYPAVQATGATNSSYWDLIIEGFNYRAGYDAATSYNIGDVVRYVSSSYIMLKDRQTNVTPGSDGTVWQIVAQGDTGAVLTTRGDIIVQDASQATRLPIGVVGSVLTTDGTDPVWSSAEGANVLYVANSGDDTNPGTQFLPFKTINKALDVASSGDIVDINSVAGGTGGTPGTYDLDQTATNGSGTGAKIRVILDGSSIPTVKIINGGSGHTAGNTVTFGNIGTDGSTVQGGGMSNITFDVTSVSVGDVVYVKNGVYRENLPLRIKAGITVQGESLRGTEVRPASSTGSQVKTVSISSNVSGASNGTYNYVHANATNGSGVAASFVANVTVSGGAASAVTVYHGGTGFAVGNTITIPAASVGNGGNLVLTVASLQDNNASDMFLMNNTTNLVQMSMKGLTGTPTGKGTGKAAVTSLDPSGSITTASPYVQNCSSLNAGATGIEIDGNLHSAGNKSILANDFTQINSDGIGVHCLAGGRGEMVSIFTYYCDKSFFAHSGGFIRGLNCSSGYGEKGAVAEGTLTSETVTSVVSRGEILKYNSTTFVGAATESDVSDTVSTSGTPTAAAIVGVSSGATATIIRTNISLDFFHITGRSGNFTQGETVTITKDDSSTYQVQLDSSLGDSTAAQTGQQGALIAVSSSDGTLSSGSAISVGANIQFAGDSTYYRVSAVTETNTSAQTALVRLTASVTNSNAIANNTNTTISTKFSNVRLTGHDFLDIGTGDFTTSNYPGGPSQAADQTDEVNELLGGRVYFTSTDQNGDFRVGDLFRIEQATGVATLNADAFDLSGLNELQLGSIGAELGATINEFSTDETFSNDANSAVPTERAVVGFLKRDKMGTDAMVPPTGTTAERPTGGNLFTGGIRFNSTLVTWEGYNGSQWTGLGGGNPWSTITFDGSTVTTVAANDRNFVDTSSASGSINLPASPLVGDQVSFVDMAGNADTNNITINRNGKKIQALTENLTIDKDHAGICLVYTGTTYGWVLRESL